MMQRPSKDSWRDAPGLRRRRALPRPALLADEAAARIRSMIVDGELALGQRISENVLAAHFGVSTTPVREAFALLRREGLVRIVPQSGTYVFTLEPGELTQLCELRVALEPVALRLGFERDRAGLAQRLTRIVASMRKAQADKRPNDYLHLDTKFHDVLIDLGGNAYIAEAYRIIAAKMAALRIRLGSDPHHLVKSMREHAAMAKLIGRGDLEAAETILLRHIARKEGSYWEHLDPSASVLLVHQHAE
jgi:DNA-binding GntR family transcriptional regulator